MGGEGSPSWQMTSPICIEIPSYLRWKEMFMPVFADKFPDEYQEYVSMIRKYN